MLFLSDSKTQESLVFRRTAQGTAAFGKFCDNPQQFALYYAASTGHTASGQLRRIHGSWPSMLVAISCVLT